jgi:hypothetical protein
MRSDRRRTTWSVWYRTASGHEASFVNRVGRTFKRQRHSESGHLVALTRNISRNLKIPLVSGLFGARHDLEPERGRAAPEGLDAELPLLFLVALPSLIDKGFTAGAIGAGAGERIKSNSRRIGAVAAGDSLDTVPIPAAPPER